MFVEIIGFVHLQYKKFRVPTFPAFLRLLPLFFVRSFPEFFFFIYSVRACRYIFFIVFYIIIFLYYDIFILLFGVISRLLRFFFVKMSLVRSCSSPPFVFLF